MGNRLKIFIIVLVIIGISGAIFLAIELEKNAPQRSSIFSSKIMLDDLWKAYKSNNLEKTTLRTFDSTNSYITTSEGQSYTMLRSIWMDDRSTFDTSWKWTKDNLGHKNDKLLSWEFGQKADGSYGILVDRGGQVSATDANIDIALALLMAYSKWNDNSYLYDAHPLIIDIWNNEVVPVKGQYVLTANEFERLRKDGELLVNPSYFSPYSFRIFAQVDKAHDWNKLADDSYDLLIKSMQSNLDKKSTANLPPNWFQINKSTGIISAAPNRDTDYGFDAIRIPWRMYISYKWFNDQKALDVLKKLKFFETEWQNKKSIFAVYEHDGTPAVNYESYAAYGGVLGYFLLNNPTEAANIFKNKIQPLYSIDIRKWKTPLTYYDDNWVSFGMMSYTDALFNFTSLSHF